LIVLKSTQSSDDEDSEKSEEEEESDEESEDSEDSGKEKKSKIPKFEKKISDMTNYKFSNKNRVVTYNGNSDWTGTALATKSKKWCARLGSNCSLLMIGMASKNIQKGRYNWGGNDEAFYFYCSTGGLYRYLFIKK
jgi:hypothetical protein